MDDVICLMHTGKAEELQQLTKTVMYRCETISSQEGDKKEEEEYLLK